MNNNDSEKHFVLAFVLLLIVGVAAVLGYYFFIAPKKATSNQNNGQSQSTNNTGSNSSSNSNGGSGTSTSDKALFKLVADYPELSKINTLLKASSLESDLSNANKKFTAFFPTDSALAGTTLPTTKTDIDKFLKRFIVAEEDTSSQLIKITNQTLQNLNGDKLTVSVKDGAIRVNDAPITQVDIDASNGKLFILSKTY